MHIYHAHTDSERTYGEIKEKVDGEGEDIAVVAVSVHEQLVKRDV